MMNKESILNIKKSTDEQFENAIKIINYQNNNSKNLTSQENIMQFESIAPMILASMLPCATNYKWLLEEVLNSIEE